MTETRTIKSLKKERKPKSFYHVCLVKEHWSFYLVLSVIIVP